MVKKFIILTIILLLMTGCMNTSDGSGVYESTDVDSTVLDSDLSTCVEDIYDEKSPQNSENSDSEIKPNESTNSLLYFDPSSLFFGSAVKELKAAFSDLEKKEPYMNPIVYYSKESDISFFGWADDGSTNEESIRIREIRAPAKTVFPNMGEQVLRSEIEKIIGEDLNIEMYGEMIAYFSYQGGVFTYSAEDSYDLFPETSLLVEYNGYTK